jgi:hypothetical protein
MIWLFSADDEFRTQWEIPLEAPQWAVDLEKRHGDHLSATDPVWQHATCDERHHTVTWHLPGENE